MSEPSAPNAATDDTKRGLYRKYSVRRENDDAGKHDGCRYFVLDPQHDFHAWTALEAYAMSCQADYPELAKDLFAWLTEAGSAFK